MRIPFPARIRTVLGMGAILVMAAGCNNPPEPPQPGPIEAKRLYVGNTVPPVGSTIPVIQIYDIADGATGLPDLIPQPSIPMPAAAGAALAMKVVGKSLYVAGGSGVVAHFTIDSMTGNLTPNGTMPAGSPPYSMAAKSTALYVANRMSNNVSAYAIDPDGNLTPLPTTAVNAVNAVEIDTAGRFLFTGSRMSGATRPQVCAHAIQPDGALGAMPMCVDVNGAPEAMKFSGGVLFLLFNATVPPAPGNSNWISAWTVDPATGALTHRGMDLDIGAANAGGMAVSVNGQSLFVPRQGGFITVSTANPMSMSPVTFANTGSQFCVLPPVGAGEVLAHPGGRVIYVADPIGVAGPGTGNNIQGARVSVLEIPATGGLTAIRCDAAGGKPITMAMLVP